MLFDKLKDIKAEEDFIKFLKLIDNDFKNNREEWQNLDISTYFDCAAAWAEESIDGLKNYNKDSNPWKRCAEILYMGKIYE